MKIEPITAAGGVLYQYENGTPLVLLIYRRGVWDIPKGKLEEDESIEECARREVAEEVGIALPEITAELTNTYHEYQENGRTMGKTTHWFAMKTPVRKVERFSPELEEQIQKVQWFPLEEAREKVGFDNLRTVLNSFEKELADSA